MARSNTVCGPDVLLPLPVTFVFSDSGTTIDSMHPTTAEGFERFEEAIAKKIVQFEVNSQHTLDRFMISCKSSTN